VDVLLLGFSALRGGRGQVCVRTVSEVGGKWEQPGVKKGKISGSSSSMTVKDALLAYRGDEGVLKMAWKGREKGDFLCENPTPISTARLHLTRMKRGPKREERREPSKGSFTSSNLRGGLSKGDGEKYLPLISRPLQSLVSATVLEAMQLAGKEGWCAALQIGCKCCSPPGIKRKNRTRHTDGHG